MASWQHNFIRDAVTKGLIKIEYIGTRNQFDLLTKSLDFNKFHRFHKSLGLQDWERVL